LIHLTATGELALESIDESGFHGMRQRHLRPSSFPLLDSVLSLIAQEQTRQWPSAYMVSLPTDDGVDQRLFAGMMTLPSCLHCVDVD
jgi:hypothetical protein